LAGAWQRKCRAALVCEPGRKNFDMSNMEQRPTWRKEKPGGARHRRKGSRIERELVALHRTLGVHAERYPLSGASRFRSGHDIDCYAFGMEEAPLVCEVKGRKNGASFITLEKWLGNYDALFLRRNNADPLVLLPWRLWSRLLDRVRR
jgi:Holliday junction resolvase